MIEILHRVKIALLILLALLIFTCVGLLLLSSSKSKHYVNGVYVYHFYQIGVEDYGKTV